jgi:hypothetical protein
MAGDKWEHCARLRPAGNGSRSYCNGPIYINMGKLGKVYGRHANQDRAHTASILVALVGVPSEPACQVHQDCLVVRRSAQAGIRHGDAGRADEGVKGRNG